VTLRRVGAGALWVEQGGTGSPTLVLLHGLGANAAVWEPLRPWLARSWPGRWLAPDLRGHGRSSPDGLRGYAGHAADVAALLDPGEEVVLLGHSMGGVVAMALATGWFGVTVRRVVAFGVKLIWTDEETAKFQALGRAPVRWFETRAEAAGRALRAAGLDGLVDPASPVAAAGVVEEGGRFRLAAGPWAYSVVGPPVTDFARAARAPLRLAAGARDPMVTAEQMRALDPDAVVWDGLGHNPHVEAPERVGQLVADLAGPSLAGRT
jgi:pimeloyl-ACP methyl ester carboxylesterase